MEAERRQVTVLFTDMVGFTAFSERSGEEAAFTSMRSLSKLMDDAVREQGGVVQGFTGDGIIERGLAWISELEQIRIVLGEQARR